MTYKENSNVFLKESKLPCGICAIIQYEDVYRNSGHFDWFYGTSLEDRYVSREANLNGNYVLMATNHSSHDYCFPGPAVRNGDCIYMMSKPDSSDYSKKVYAREYQISTNTYTDILAYTFNTTYTPHFIISFLDERKILTLERSHHIGTSQPYNYYDYIWLVDFEAGTSTKILEIPVSISPAPSEETVEIESIKTLQKDNGDIWIYLVGWHYTWSTQYTGYVGGISVHYYNYTQGGTWGRVYVDVAPSGDRSISIESIMYQDPVFINKDYLVVISSTSYSPGNWEGGFTGYAFNLNTNTIARSELLQSTDNYREPLCFFSAPNNYNGILYFQAYNFYDAGTAVMKFDPETLEISTVYTSDDPYGDYDIGMFSTRCEAYFYDGASNNFYKAEGVREIGNFSSVFPDYSVLGRGESYILDDNGPSFWYWDDTNTTLKQIDFYKRVLNSYYLPLEYPVIGIFHFGSCLVIETANVTYWNSITHYYLIT